MVLVRLTQLQALLKLSRSMVFELAGKMPRDGNRPSALRGLGFFEIPASALAVEKHCALNRNGSRFQIHVRPLKS